MDFDTFKAINDEKRNVGVISVPSVIKTFTNEACGDDFTVYLLIEDDVIVDASFTTTGCGFGLAALSIATDWVKGKSLEDAEGITEADVDAAIGGFPERRRRYPETAALIIRESVQKYRRQVKALA
jgi:NifU-like protein involved in Fe-S cluster formation